MPFIFKKSLSLHKILLLSIAIPVGLHAVNPTKNNKELSYLLISHSPGLQTDPAVQVTFKGKSDDTYITNGNDGTCLHDATIGVFNNTGGGTIASNIPVTGSVFLPLPTGSYAHGSSGPWNINSSGLGYIIFNAIDGSGSTLSDVGSFSMAFQSDPTSGTLGDVCIGFGFDVANINSVSISCSGTDQDNATCSCAGGACPEIAEIV